MYHKVHLIKKVLKLNIVNRVPIMLFLKIQ